MIGPQHPAVTIVISAALSVWLTLLALNYKGLAERMARRRWLRPLPPQPVWFTRVVSGFGAIGMSVLLVATVEYTLR